MAEPITTPQTVTNPLWDFSLAIYRSKAVQQACLDLQDGSGIDVNVMLYMLWLASLGRRLNTGDAKAVLAAVEPWRVDVVVPLRTARRALRQPTPGFEPSGAESLRNAVKKVELEAERLQQAALHAFRAPAAIGHAAATSQAAPANLAAYGEALGRQLAPGPVGVMLAAFKDLVEKGTAKS